MELRILVEQIVNWLVSGFLRSLNSFLRCFRMPRPHEPETPPSRGEFPLDTTNKSTDIFISLVSGDLQAFLSLVQEGRLIVCDKSNWKVVAKLHLYHEDSATPASGDSLPECPSIASNDADIPSGNTGISLGRDADVSSGKGAGIPSTEADIPLEDADITSDANTSPKYHIPLGNAAEIPLGQNADIPAGDADMPAGVADMPAGDADIPAGDADIPAGDADIPAGDADIPAGDADIPAGDADIPAGDADIPAGDADIPAGDADIPAGDANIPAGDADIPAGDADIPAGDADIPAGDADIPAGDADIPAGDADIPAGDVDIPAGDADIPAGDADIPAGDADIPAGDSDGPSAAEPERGPDVPPK
ncbi:vesicle-associated protein-like isoform X2 [Penaeus chinensis]|nr:vesicle-associated protein-like isoform X2 [Penaeus chinensis]